MQESVSVATPEFVFLACLRKRTSIIHIRSWTYKAHTCTSKYISLFHHRYVLISVHLDISLCVALSCSLATYVCDIFGAEAIRKRAGAGQGAPHHDTQGDQDVVKPPSDNISAVKPQQVRVCVCVITCDVFLSLLSLLSLFSLCLDLSLSLSLSVSASFAVSLCVRVYVTHNAAY